MWFTSRVWWFCSTVCWLRSRCCWRSSCSSCTLACSFSNACRQARCSASTFSSFSLKGRQTYIHIWHTTSDNSYSKGVHTCLMYLSLWIWFFNSSWFLYVVWSSSLVSSSSPFSTDTAFSSASNCCSIPLLFSASREERRSCDTVCSCCSRNSSSSTKQCTELKSACFLFVFQYFFSQINCEKHTIFMQLMLRFHALFFCSV